MSESKPRGFATLTPERRKEIARKGGKSAHAKGTAHEFTPEEGRRAGRLGGQATTNRKRAQGVSHPDPTPAREGE
jgi:general stress protein YciG